MKPYNNMYKNSASETGNKEAVSTPVKETKEEVKPEVKEEAPVIKVETHEIKVEKKAPVETKAKDKTAKVVNCEMVNVRMEPSTMSSVLEIVENGGAVKVFDKTGDFTKVETKRGTKGYIMSDYLKEE